MRGRKKNYFISFDGISHTFFLHGRFLYMPLLVILLFSLYLKLSKMFSLTEMEHMRVVNYGGLLRERSFG